MPSVPNDATAQVVIRCGWRPDPHTEPCGIRGVIGEHGRGYHRLGPDDFATFLDTGTGMHAFEPATDGPR